MRSSVSPRNPPHVCKNSNCTGRLHAARKLDTKLNLAKDRLVVMVTHNPELAEQYATRIVKLRDGRIIDDSDTYEVDTHELKKPEHKNIGLTLLLLIPGNAIIHSLTGSTAVNAALPVASAIILIVLSVILTLIPSKKAAKKDPVAALRTE